MFMRKPVDFDTESFQFAPEAMKLHKKFDLFKYILSLHVDKKAFEVSIFRSLSQARETIYTSTK